MGRLSRFGFVIITGTLLAHLSASCQRVDLKGVRKWRARAQTAPFFFDRSCAKT